jgi:F-type H+-transporting ATPase subunit a
LLASLSRPRVFIPLIVCLILFVLGFVFLKGPLEIPGLKIDPLFRIANYPVRNTVLQQLLAMGVLLGIGIAGARKPDMIPKRLQALVEIAVEGLLNLCQTAAGRKNGRRFFPVIATLFLFVLSANWLGIIPGTGTIGVVVPAEEAIHHAEKEGKHAEDVHLFMMTESGNIPFGLSYTLEEGGDKHTSYAISGEEFHHSEEHLERQGLTAGHFIGFLRPANTDVNTTAALALISAIFVEFWGITSLGFFSYMSKFFNFKALLKGNIGMGLIDVFVGILELVGEFVRLISFTFRLFGNSFAGEVLILIIMFLVPVLFPVLTFGMELFFGAIQAFIFAMLTLVFGIMAITRHGGEHGETQH